MTDEWVELAACKNMDTELFFPRSGGNGYRLAREACFRCSVRAECLEDVLAFEATLTAGWSNLRHGMAGGKTPDDRNEMVGCLGTNRRSRYDGEAKSDPRAVVAAGGRDRETLGASR